MIKLPLVNSTIQTTMKTKYVYFIVLALAISACSHKEDNDFIEGTSYILTARKCNYAWAFNAYIKKFSDEWGNYTRISPFQKDTMIKTSDFVLGFTTCNVDIKDMKKHPYRGDYQEEYKKYGENMFIDYPPFNALSYMTENMADEKDPVIETRLRQQLESSKTRTVSSDLPTTVLIRVDYRLTWLKDIKITCSAEIAGRAAGQSLTDLFVVQGYYEHHDFIVTSNKNVITDKTRIKGISLQQYLSYKPMAPAEIFLRFKEGVNVSAPVTAQFTVELITGEDKSIKTTAAAVKFVP